MERGELPTSSREDGKGHVSVEGGREGPASVEGGEKVLVFAQEKGEFPMGCGVAGLSSVAMILLVSSPEKRFIFLGYLSGTLLVQYPS